MTIQPVIKSAVIAIVPFFHPDYLRSAAGVAMWSIPAVVTVRLRIRGCYRSRTSPAMPYSGSESKIFLIAACRALDRYFEVSI